MNTTTSPLNGTSHPWLDVLRPSEIAAGDWRPVADSPGVDQLELERCGDFVHSLVRYRPLSRTPGHPHLAAYHHLWVVAGSALVSGRPVTAGTYLTIPPGAGHAISAPGADGCVVLWIHCPMHYAHG
jgi:hypothetical protein